MHKIEESTSDWAEIGTY